ncbi:MAG: family transporter, partial [Citricoccus sp.]|nr:family transporter [Citricoccus sp. WCRC_4]
MDQQTTTGIVPDAAPPTTASIEFGATRQLTTREANRVALGALIGTALEWYDFFLFSAAAALVFNVQFFHTDNATAAALSSFATFGVGLAARPLGGLVFGHLGDRIGRRKVLMITIVGIGLVTGLIGMLPTYAAIGLAAPLLLVLLRIGQGLFVGGEWSGAMTIVVENSPLEKRAIYAAIPQIGSPIGTVLSSGGFYLLALWMTQESFDAWGWRVPFLAAIPMLLVALYIRSRLEESPVFEELM